VVSPLRRDQVVGKLAASFNRIHLEQQDREGGLLGVMIILFLVLVDLLYHRQANLAATLVMAPVAAAALARPAVVGAVGVVAFAVSIGMTDYDMGFQGAVVKVAVVGVGGVVGILTARHRQTLQARAIRLKSIADAAESALLRPLPKRVGPASLSGWHVAAKEDARVGGDFYEALPYGSKARWVIGDARGHGVEAIRLGAAVVGAFREAASRLESLSEVAERVEESLAGFLEEEDFVTAMFAELGHDGSLKIINCGHPQPLLLSGPRARVLGVVPTTPLGLEPELSASALTLTAGDSLCFHTDGLDEIRPGRGPGVDALALVEGLGELSADGVSSAIRERLRSRAKSVQVEDDVSVLVLKFLPLSGMDRPTLRSDAEPGPTAATRA
jgi:sigma-B regulation protein RsbU (phosphoserine phosphatase)